ncbi:CfaE/CblD family pilus tip adhesin [Yersinia enterocolitica]|uniref:CfaE/CblD family pilus tip adhesin n=1 Tax=Yersinia enterocolitica TaxID=630 RepID=UPI0025AA4825|nr:CfaE/CblD family pilus tip adhesin [Yersinia enterocolitica]MDN0097737.1 CfaE/CblD family pilus tip adhesin [Yersinia enterocolitica]
MKNHFGKRISYLLGIIMGILLSLSSAKADEWSRNYHVEAAIDLIHPGSVPVWKDVSFKGTLPGGRIAGDMGLVCGSESDTSFGACPTMLKWAGYHEATNVKLRFTNIKTKATVDLTVTGNMRGVGCAAHTGFTGLDSACYTEEIDFEATLPETELRKLPYGGVWGAQMRLKTKEWLDNPIGDVVTDIRLNVRSEASISIPNPTVKLPVTMTGHHLKSVTVDTCLFDGTGAGDSSRYELRLDDVSGAARGFLFALKNVTKPDARPLYYTVSAGTPGTNGDKTVWTPGLSKAFTGMDEVPIAGTMTIGGKAVPCVQWPLTLKLLSFNPVRQAMGQYQGQINLVFTPSLNMP